MSIFGLKLKFRVKELNPVLNDFPFVFGNFLSSLLLLGSYRDLFALIFEKFRVCLKVDRMSSDEVKETKDLYLSNVLAVCYGRQPSA